jgi:hypothetical protein
LIIVKGTDGDCIDRCALSLPSAKRVQQILTAKDSLHAVREPRTHSYGPTHRSSQTKVASALQAANKTRCEKDRADGNIALPRYPEDFPVNPGAWRHRTPT